METKLKVEGMTCGGCVRHVKQSLEAVPGVRHAEVSLEPGAATVQHESADVPAMIAALERDGYRAKEA
jgi:copper chaperone